MAAWQQCRPEDHAGISPGQVHVWRVRIVSSLAKEADVAWGVLAPDERERAGRFHFEQDRRRFIATRAAVRRILAAYVETDPRELTFTSGPHGKPEIAGSGGPIRFSTARSGEVGLVAVAHDAEVGVDVELIVDDFPWEEVALQVFATGELASIEALPEHERVRGFALAWVRKEAWAKAIGLGIAHVLDADHEIPDLGPIVVHDLEPLLGYVGGLAMGNGLAVKLWDFVKEGTE